MHHAREPRGDAALERKGMVGPCDEGGWPAASHTSQAPPAVTERALLAVQLAATLAGAVAAHRRRSLLPAALALGALQVLTIASYAARGHPRLAVAVFAAWPAPVAALLLYRCHTPGASPEKLEIKGARLLQSLVLLPFALTPPLLALFGSVLASWWPWPLRAPRLAVGALATALAWRRGGRRFSPVEQVGLLLAAGQTAGVLVDAWSPWERMREVSACTYIVAALVLAWAARRP